MMFVLYTLHVLICFFLIAVVLLQQGKGADLSVFGGGGTQTAFGARGAATVLHKLSVGSFIAFIVTTLAIGVVQGDRSSSLIENLPEQTAPVDEADDAATEEADEAGALEPGEADEAGALEPAATDDATDGTTDATADGEPAADTPADDTPADDTPADDT
ncbi:MAG: preprotein translocase subunit SecG, partial [Acidobacteriota bacterium]